MSFIDLAHRIGERVTEAPGGAAIAAGVGGGATLLGVAEAFPGVTTPEQLYVAVTGALVASLLGLLAFVVKERRQTAGKVSGDKLLESLERSIGGVSRDIGSLRDDVERTRDDTSRQITGVNLRLDNVTEMLRLHQLTTATTIADHTARLEFVMGRVEENTGRINTLAERGSNRA